MIKKLSILFSVVILFGMSSLIVSAQGGAKKGPDPSTIRDPDIEKDSLHNLDVARQYFKGKKAYLASLQRCEEIIAGNPGFSRIDEVLFIAGESSLRLALKEGKQTTKTPVEQLKQDARGYLSQIVNSYPDSAFKKEAESDLESLGGPLKPPVKTAGN